VRGVFHHTGRTQKQGVAIMETNLQWVSRLRSSTNGNPRFELHTDDGTYITQSDAACNYEVENIARHCPVKVELSLTRASRVWNIVQVSA
jgi:hypothetical protein